MKIATIICRVLLGLGFTIFGANILHPFLPMPPFPEGSMEAQFMVLMGGTHWMDLIGTFELLGGLLVLSGRFLPLGLAVLAPLLVNILAFHILISGGAGIAPGLVFSVLEVVLIAAHWKHFRPIFTAGNAVH